ncbi:MAG: hypothetical protein H6835_07115 [Planctomycetes bacterium]|nr:hypothetical protein [Planctomycetota bacterium]
MNVRIARSVVAALLLVAAAAAQEWQTFAIGKVGAAVEVDGDWRRRVEDEYDEDYGGDQFEVRHRAAAFGRLRRAQVVVREVRSLLDGEGDLRRLLDAWNPSGAATPVEIASLPSFVHATRTYEVVSQGVQLVVRCDLLVRPGLAYHVMSWSDRSDAALVASCAAQVVDGFAFPGADSEWGSSEAPTRAELRIGGLRVVVPFAEAVWQRLPVTGDAPLVLESVGGDQRLTGFVIAAASVDAAVGAERGGLLRWDDSLVATPVRAVSFAGLDAKVFDASTGKTSFRSVCVEAEPGRYLVLRYRAPGAVDEVRPHRDALLAAVQLVPIVEAVQLPPLPKRSPRRIDDRLAAFVDACRTFPGPSAVRSQPVQMLQDQSYVVRGWGQLDRVDWDGTSRLADLSQDLGGTGVLWRGQVWVQHPGAWRAYGGAGSGPAPQDAELATANDDTLWLWRRAADATPAMPPPAVARGWPWHDGLLVQVDAQGASVERARLRACSIDGMIANRRGDVALHGFQRRAFGDEVGRSVVWRVAADGVVHELGAWTSVTGVAPARDGFVVAGLPVDGAAGIWLFADDRPGELLVSGDRMQPLGQPFDRLEFLFDGGDASYFVRATLADCRERGRLCQPFSAADLDAIGAELMATVAAPRSAQELTLACGLADDLAQRRCGAPFAAGSDELAVLFRCSRSGDGSRVSTACRTLLALLTARQVVADGGEFVAADAADWSAWNEARGSGESTPFALCVAPAVVVADELSDDYGGAFGLARLREARGNGLRVLIGVHGDALQQRERVLAPAGFGSALATGDTAVLAPVLAAAPANAPLREAVYAALADAGAAAALQSLAEEQARRGEALPVDVVAWLGMRVGGLTAGDVEVARALCGEVQAALDRFPGEPRLALLLGDVARLAFADDPAQARRCYEWVTTAVHHGPLHERAARALRELDGR